MNTRPFKVFLPPAVRPDTPYYQPCESEPDGYNYSYTPQMVNFPFQTEITSGQPSLRFENSADFSRRTGAQLVFFGTTSLPSTALISEEEETVVVLSDELLERGQTVVYTNDKKDRILCYFTVTICARVEKYSRTAVTNELEILVKSSQHERTIVIALTKFHSLLAEIRTNLPQFRTNASFGNVSAFFSDYIALKFNLFLATEVVKREFSYHGWAFLHGEPVYLNDRLPFCKSGCYVWAVEPENIASIFRNGMGFLSIGNGLEKILPIFLYAHIGFTARLFKDAGLAVQFLLLIVGRTNSFKTSLSREIFMPFSPIDMMNFQSTPRAIELYREAVQDMVLFLDDIFASGDGNVMEKFENLLRTFGDGVSRAKSNKRSDGIERSDVCGGAVVTAESDLNSQQSSRLRYLTVPVDNSSFDSEKLRYFQNDSILAKQQGSASLMQMYFSAFIFFLERHYDEIVKEIMAIDGTIEPLPVKFPRLNTIYKAMIILARIVLRFGLTYNALTKTEATATLHQWEAVIQQVILLTQADSTIIEPYLAFLVALSQGIACREISLASDKISFFEAGSDYHGFRDQENGRLYLRSDKVLVYAQKYYAAIGEKFDSTAAEVGKALLANGISIADNEAGHTRTTKKVNYKDTKSLRMLCIIEPAMAAKLAEIG